MYPMKLKPVYKDYLWGGNELEKLYDKAGDGEITAESWELCCHPDGMSVIANGKYKGKYLKDILDESPKMVRPGQKRGEKFPILIKFIDAKKDLSIQVHPSDETAIKEAGEEGKAEMWYVIAAKPKAFLYYGLSRRVEKEELRQRMEDGSICDICNKVRVAPGDVFFIHPGTIHAIGAGTVIAEIQQSSNTTFRVYDFKRKDKNGNTRELHIDRAIDVIDREPVVPSQVMDNNEVRTKNGLIRRLFGCEYFHVLLIHVKKDRMKLWCDDSSFHSLLIIRGEGHLEHKGKRYQFRSGDSYFLPAGIGEYQIYGECKVLLSKV